MAEVYQLIVGGTLCNQPVENVLNFTCSTDPFVGGPLLGASALIDAWQGTAEALWMDSLPDNYTCLGYKAKRVNSGGGATVGRNLAPVLNGTRGSAASDSAVGPVILLPYSNGVRWANGRIFLPGAGDDDLDDNVFAAGLLAALGLLIAALVAPLPGGPGGPTFSLVVYRRAVIGGADPHAEAIFDVDAGGVSVKPGIQNGRLRPVF